MPASAMPAPGARVVARHDFGHDWGVLTVETSGSSHAHQASPCARCPWRRDAPTGAFPAAVFRHSARVTYDLATHTFGCHAASLLLCAGFLLRGASDNLAIRMARTDFSDVHSDVELYDDYREMAIANGVAPDDPALVPCRGDRTVIYRNPER
ncbi:DUF6283 family protein [Actinomadura yumaensis]|uniref:DUF6283 family protein n=1 Tax=Actinomadura yumaensis TaxID=111807 RepID=UPI00361EAADB